MTINVDTPVVPSLTQQLATAWSASHQLAPYQLYALTIDYDDTFQIIPQPLAAPDGTQVKHIKLQSAYTLVTVRWAGVRSGEHPEVPNPAPPAGSNFVLISRRTSPEAPRLSPDGNTRLYAISGAYVYSLTNPTVGVGGLPMGRLPSDATTAALYVYSALDFYNTIFPLA